MRKSAQVLHSGFTLVELLVVIAIIAILAAVVVLVINPVELTRRGRDATRLSDVATLTNAITVALQENASVANFLCDGAAPTGTPPRCGGNSGADGTEADGSGWVTVDLAGQQAVKVPALPRDPGTNTGVYVYTYSSDGTDWEINAVLESTEHYTKMNTDGGNTNDVTGCPSACSASPKYEVGSKLDLL